MAFVTETGDGIRCGHDHMTEADAILCGLHAGATSWRVTEPGNHSYQLPADPLAKTSDGRFYPRDYEPVQQRIVADGGVVQDPDDCGKDQIPCLVCSVCVAECGPPDQFDAIYH